MKEKEREELKKEEIRLIISKLRRGKAAGRQNKAWLWEMEGLKEALEKICKKV